MQVSWPCRVVQSEQEVKVTLSTVLLGVGKQFIALPVRDHFLIGSFLIFDLIAAPRFGMWVYSLFVLPGVLGHEICHWLVALILGARPSFPNIIPKHDSNGWKLGSVQFVPNLLTLIPIALAPFLLLPLGIWYAVFVMHPSAGGWWWFHGWIVSTLLVASLPSRQDWKVAMPAIVCALALSYLAHRSGLF
jgi:hypothetical protein